MNNFTRGKQDQYAKWMNNESSKANSFMNNIQQDINKTDVNLQINPKLDFDTSYVDADQMRKDLQYQVQYFKTHADDPATEQQLARIQQKLTNSFALTPAT